MKGHAGTDKSAVRYKDIKRRRSRSHRNRKSAVREREVKVKIAQQPTVSCPKVITVKVT